MPIFPQHPSPESLRARPAEDLLSPATRMGAVELLVADLDATLDYYTRGVTLGVLEHAGDTAVLGRDGRTIVRLRQVKELPPARRGQAGLFHTAVLFEDEAALAAAVASVATAFPGSFTGSADHLYSQAFYFDDPEGNGVELYADRPRETWRRETSGLLTLATNPLDPNAFLGEHLPGAAPATRTAPPATLGHVHLQVGDIGLGRQFYVDVLGFEVMSDIGSALFVAAGGYHHHLALNTWNSAGAGPRAASLGLGRVNIDLPGAEDVAALQERLAHHGVATRHDGAVLRFEDPWRTLVEVAAAA
ncbi:glyoxalase [Kocuria flava]|uniref:Glyoxalase n=1 Tax=Kocuria flava TaxID=446860 RepID=A0A2N4T0F9_9MICC|nr:VOC family protein [Kocuria flava]PLC11703.1 glyoxalase [Kocuria flava]